MNKIAKFEKVSYEQYKKTCLALNYLPMSKEDFDKIIPTPTRGTAGSAGYDLCSTRDVTLKPNQEIVIPTGMRANIQVGYWLMIVPRSGMGFKYNVMLANTVGVIDSDYYHSDNEGHIMVKLVNKGNKNLRINTGKKFVQGVFVPFGITHDDEATDVRNGGFGSTGK